MAKLWGNYFGKYPPPWMKRLLWFAITHKKHISYINLNAMIVPSLVGQIHISGTIGDKENRPQWQLLFVEEVTLIKKYGVCSLVVGYERE